jgi:hypothetical protein
MGVSERTDEMGNRCTDCNKFVSLEDGDVDVSNEDTSDEQVTVEVRIVQTCADCGTDMKEASLTIERDLSEEHNFEAEHVDAEGKEIDEDGIWTAKQLAAVLFALLTDLDDPGIHDAIEDALNECKVEHELEVKDTSLENDSWSKGKGRYCETFRGVSGTIEVTCSCGWEHVINVTAKDDDASIPASGMDDCN